MSDTSPSRDDVLSRAHQILDQNAAVALASATGEATPWVLGAYYTREGDDLLLFLETSGKSLSNLRQNPSVAFLVSQNDAMKDFLQGAGVATLLGPEEYDGVMDKLKAKIPGFQLYTPCTPVRVQPQKLHVSSLSSGWFPAKVVAF